MKCLDPGTTVNKQQNKANKASWTDLVTSNSHSNSSRFTVRNKEIRQNSFITLTFCCTEFQSYKSPVLTIIM